jgi:hypothetical protein
MMKKITLSALAAITVAGTAMAGPATVVTSKEYKQPAVTPCFRDTEFQLDLFYSYNDASHQGDNQRSQTDYFGPATTPVTGKLVPGGSTLLGTSDYIPAGSTATGVRSTTIKDTPYFRDGSGGGVGLNYFFWRYVGVGVEGNWWNGVNDGYNGSYTTNEVVNLSSPIDASTLAAAARASHTSITQVDANTLLLKRSVKFGNTNKSTANQVTGSLILRYPFEGCVCWAPYIFGGGGGVFDGDASGFGHIGLGVEYRVTPYLGFFTDWRWEFFGGNNSEDDYRNSSAVKELSKVVSIRDLRGDSNNRNDVSVTRVGVRFVF